MVPPYDTAFVVPFFSFRHGMMQWWYSCVKTIDNTLTPIREAQTTANIFSIVRSLVSMARKNKYDNKNVYCVNPPRVICHTTNPTKINKVHVLIAHPVMDTYRPYGQ